MCVKNSCGSRHVKIFRGYSFLSFHGWMVRRDGSWVLWFPYLAKTKSWQPYIGSSDFNIWSFTGPWNPKILPPGFSLSRPSAKASSVRQPPAGSDSDPIPVFFPDELKLSCVFLVPKMKEVSSPKQGRWPGVSSYFLFHVLNDTNGGFSFQATGWGLQFLSTVIF